MEEHKKEKQIPSATQSKQKEDEKKDTPPLQPQRIKKDRPEVIIVRGWKEYGGESLLIIFSVILALILTEVFNKLHEEQHTKEVLFQLREELIANKKAEEVQYTYHLQVLGNINLALHDSVLAQKFINNGVIDSNLSPIAPQGVLIRDLNDVAWQVAKQNNIFSKIDLSTYSLLTDIYDNQQRITKSEDEIAKVLISWESRKPENLRTTLILIRDNYHAWAVDRAPRLLKLYQQAIDKLKKY
jgi:hypothetical protein